MLASNNIHVLDTNTTLFYIKNTKKTNIVAFKSKSKATEFAHMHEQLDGSKLTIRTFNKQIVLNQCITQNFALTIYDEGCDYITYNDDIFALVILLPLKKSITTYFDKERHANIYARVLRITHKNIRCYVSCVKRSDVVFCKEYKYITLD